MCGSGNCYLNCHGSQNFGISSRLLQCLCLWFGGLHILDEIELVTVFWESCVQWCYYRCLPLFTYNCHIAEPFISASFSTDREKKISDLSKLTLIRITFTIVFILSYYSFQLLAHLVKNLVFLISFFFALTFFWLLTNHCSQKTE